VSLKAFALPFAMPAWLAIFCFQLCLLAATAFRVDQPNAGPTSGGGVITIPHNLGTWNAFWTPVITLHGMQIAASDLAVNNTQIRIKKVPPGPGCNDNFLTVWSDCTASGLCGGSADDGLVVRLNTTLNYELPSISMVEPILAQFGDDDAARTMIINGTNLGKTCPDKPTVQVSC
jgi:hypothetical protein